MFHDTTTRMSYFHYVSYKFSLSYNNKEEKKKKMKEREEEEKKRRPSVTKSDVQEGDPLEQKQSAIKTYKRYNNFNYIGS